MLICNGCGRHFPEVAGFADLRLAPDRYLDLERERAKALALSQYEKITNVHSLARIYYGMTDDVDQGRRDRYLTHIDGAEHRGEALATLLPRRGRILEVGCGAGGLLVAAKRRGLRIEGTDIASRWLVVARRRLADVGMDVRLTVANAERLPWPDGAFDALVADSVLEHLDDPAAALREWARVVRPKGRLLVWSPNRHSLLADPHVGLWALGWLPHPWASRYVRWRRRCDWPLRLLSASEAGRLASRTGWGRVEVGPAVIPEHWASRGTGRAGVRFYRRVQSLPIARQMLGRFGPLWQLDALSEASR
ncbi:MAG: class I SAM-dependent methyltransferase [Isosphaeraceae bacterium]